MVKLDFYAGLDLGTTGCKCLVFDQFGKIHGKAGVEYELIFTEDGVEQDADEWWRAAADTLRRACEGLPVRAVSISTQGISGVPVGQSGECLSNAISWLDTRAEKEAKELADRVGRAELFRLTGKPSYPYSLPQLAWIQRNRPKTYQKTWKYMLPLDYLNFRLTGIPLMDYSVASGTMAFDIARHQMIPEFFQCLEMKESLFSQVRQWGVPFGKITQYAAGMTGLAEGTTVALGAQDQRCAALGAGICQGVGTVSLGTSSAVCSLVPKPMAEPFGQITCCPVDNGDWMLESVMNTSGAALKWARKTLFGGISYDEIDALAAQSPVGANGVVFIPQLAAAAGTSHGNGAFQGIMLRHTKMDLARAVLEGIAFQIDSLIQEQASLLGGWQELRLFGGGAASQLWSQIIADVTGIPVKVTDTQETAALGAAMIAAAGDGAYPDVWNAAAHMSGAVKHIYSPNQRAHRQYCAARSKNPVRKEA